MIQFNYETDFELPHSQEKFQEWILKVITSENKELGEINYIFCDDAYLLDLNIKYLNHDTLTDIISFDYTQENVLSGDIFISVERVAENASDFGATFETELLRVMAHGVLHFCGYKDKTEAQSQIMRTKEEEAMQLFE